MNIENFKPGNEKEIVELFQLVFKREMSLEHWRWRFQDNPFGKHLIKLMWEGDKLIGHYAVSPVVVSINGKDKLTAHSLTTMTHPEFGGRGVFGALASALYADLENKLKVTSIWGFPNTNSHYGFVKKLGWNDIVVLHTLMVDASRFDKTFNEYVKEISIFSDKEELFIERQLTSSFSTFIKRSKSYLNWRFFQKPNVEYRVFVLGNEPKALIVTKIYPSKKINGKYDLNLVECFFDTPDSFSTCLSHILSNYNNEFVKITIWKNIFDREHLILERMGFIPSEPLTYIGGRGNENTPKEFFENNKWYFSMGDSDVF